MELATHYGIDEPFWIGGTVNYKAQWGWGDLHNFTYTNWATGEPKNNQIGYCTTMDRTSGKWKSTNCSEKHPTICSQLKTVPPVPCPDLFDHYSTITNKCYTWSGSTLPTYDDFQQDCVRYNSNSTLITIHSDAENALVQGYAVAYEAPVLLGLHDPYNNGSYIWADGTAVDYKNWHGSPGNGDCVFLRIESMEWYSMKCENFTDDMSSELCEIKSLN